MTKPFVDELEDDDAALEPTEIADGSPWERGEADRPVFKEYAEAARDLDEATRLVRTLRQWENEATVWVTRDGRHMPIRDMDDTHLQNTVRYLRRETRKRYGSTAILHRIVFPQLPRVTWFERFRLVWLAFRSLGGRRPGIVFRHFPYLLAELKFRKLPELTP